MPLTTKLDTLLSVYLFAFYNIEKIPRTATQHSHTLEPRLGWAFHPQDSTHLELLPGVAVKGQVKAELRHSFHFSSK